MWLLIKKKLKYSFEFVNLYLYNIVQNMKIFKKINQKM